MFPPPYDDTIPITVRDFGEGPRIAIFVCLGVFLILTVTILLRRFMRQVRTDHHPISTTPIPQTLPLDPVLEPTVSRLALVDLIGVRGSGSSISDIDSAAPLFFVDSRTSVSSEEKSSSEDVCAVCLEPLQPGQRARRLPCRHVYHDTCAVVWLIKADRCPVCAQPVVQNEDSQQQQPTRVIIADRRSESPSERSRRFPSLFRVRR